MAPRRPFLFGSGLLIFGLGVVGGIIFGFIVGTKSPSFQTYFPVFIGTYIVGMLLILAGR